MNPFHPAQHNPMDNDFNLHNSKGRELSVQLPENLLGHDDAFDEDITEPSNTLSHMNNSVVGLVVAAGSPIDIAIESNTGDHEGWSVNDFDDDEHPTSEKQQGSASITSPKLKSRRLGCESVLDSKQGGNHGTAVEPPSHGPLGQSTVADTSPDMSRALSDNFSIDQREYQVDADQASQGSKSSRLASKLQNIFDFDACENVIFDHPAWLLKNVVLQGHIYVTQKHVCFYAYMPKKRHINIYHNDGQCNVTKAGYLSKTGRRNPKYSRYWFRLQGDVLSYFTDSSNYYFPHGQINLRFATAAKLVGCENTSVHFMLESAHRTYHLRADSTQSAKEWVKSIQQVIFRTHNDGDSVKISLPIRNILDVDHCSMMGFSETCKIRVIDNDETYAIDEYFFSVFGSSAAEALGILKKLSEESVTHSHPSHSVLSQAQQNMCFSTADRNSPLPAPNIPDGLPTISESVKATLRTSSGLHVIGSTRSSSDNSRSSFDYGRHTASRSLYMRRSASLGPSDAPILTQRNLSPSPSTHHLIEPSKSSVAGTRGEDRSRSKTKHLAPSTPEDKKYNDLPLFAGPQSPSLSSTVDINPPLISKCASSFQKASHWASALNNSTKRMSGLLTTQSMEYVEKVSEMWKGDHKHFNDPCHPLPDPNPDAANIRFRQHFAFSDSESLVATYFACLVRVLPLYGKIYISRSSFCFRSLLPGTRTKLILPLKDLETAQKEKGFRLGYSGLCLVIRGFEELFFEFARADPRDDCLATLLQVLEELRHEMLPEFNQQEQQIADAAIAERDALLEVSHSSRLSGGVGSQSAQKGNHSLIFDVEASFISFKPKESLKITCLTIGSRGDVQPYIALCKQFLSDGHKPRIATHSEFRPWIEQHGIQFEPVGGDPAELMRICIEHGTFTISFLKEANSKFRGWLDDLLRSSYEACKGSDVLIESPSAMAGIHIAEKLGVPYFRAFGMPWSRTRAYPHAFVVPEMKMGGGYNYLSYVMFDGIFWKATAGQINRWRHKTLGLTNTTLEKMQPNKVPFLYNFSPSVAPPPLDYPDWIRTTGYWFLDEGQDFDPPIDLVNFLSDARRDGKKIVYVGFGSIIVPDPAKMTRDVIDAVKRADVRCVLSRGWSDRAGGMQDDTPLPSYIFQIRSAPHDWLFRQLDAAAHHGGSGTTGASLRAGIPTIIRPFFGDQFFWGLRVEALGVGIRLVKWGSVSFARALWEATRSQRMIDRAKALGNKIRSENGVDAAVESIYRDMDYARALIIAKRKDGAQIDEDEGEESWTFVGHDGGELATSEVIGSNVAGVKGVSQGHEIN